MFTRFQLKDQPPVGSFDNRQILGGSVACRGDQRAWTDIPLPGYDGFANGSLLLRICSRVMYL